MVRGRGIVSRYYYLMSMAKSAGKDFRDGAVVPFECMLMISGFQPVLCTGAIALLHLFGCHIERARKLIP